MYPHRDIPSFEKCKVFPRNRTTRIALAGRKFSGKDTIAEIMTREFDFHIFSFSDVLKQMAHEIFPFMELDYSSEDKEKKVVYHNAYTGVSYVPRMIWQSLDCLPEIWPNVFIDPVTADIWKMINAFTPSTYEQRLNLCIKDVRREAELQFVVHQQFFLIYIESDDPRSTNDLSNHKSESFQALIKSHANITFVNKRCPEHKDNIRKFLTEALISSSNNNG